MSARVLVIGGTGSGVGKTTVTLGLLAAWRRRGLAAQAFKVGPDFIDPGFHALATGRPSYNLDGWMCGRERVLETVVTRSAGADVAVVEGVMGCFDGADATGDAGSTAEVAKWLGAPVVLVIDASAQARSAAAVVRGFERFDPELRVAAVIANRVGGAAHGRMIAAAIRGSCAADPVGAIPRDDAIAVPERHLGLVTASEAPLTADRLDHLADLIEASIDVDRLLALAEPLSSAGVAAAADPESGLGGDHRGPLRARIAVARDAAFQFYYPDNLERLAAAGAALTFWSPLADLVPDADGFYIGGGYPELHARTLAANAEALRAIAERAAAGTPIYAECGGLMYLAESLEDMDGVAHRMAGVLPAAVRMSRRRSTLGYRAVRFTTGTPLAPAGSAARGHEFHHSTLDPVPPSVTRAYSIAGREGESRTEGYLLGRALLSYVHLHFASNPALAPSFVDACAGVRR
ncbi:MAG: cobyrinate a,c-diamide synthase [Candidatus Rokuibacteriota bacterium]